ncbi:hypothetical protein GQ457_02G029280 [Hibiscus cannabinus]
MLPLAGASSASCMDVRFLAHFPLSRYKGTTHCCLGSKMQTTSAQGTMRASTRSRKLSPRTKSKSSRWINLMSSLPFHSPIYGYDRDRFTSAAMIESYLITMEYS